MAADRYGLPLSTSSAAARDAYADGCHRILTMYPVAAAALDRALAEDPNFALAHAAKARALMASGDMAGAQAAAAAAREAVGAPGVSEREASHVGVISALVAGPSAAALEAVRAHVSLWPRDALIVGLAANQTGLIGLSGRAGREQEQLDFLTALAPDYGEDWWFDAHYGMALSELGHHDAARRLIERSASAEPRNAFAAHSTAHVRYETGAATDAIAYLQDWLPGYPREGGLYGHLHWHLALVLLQTGDVAGAARLYDEAFGAEDYRGLPMIKLFDSASFLWRSELAGQPRDRARWQALLAFARGTFPRPGLPFADWHVALIDAVAADATAAEARAGEIDVLAEAGRYAPGSTVARLARGVLAFERGDHATAIAEIRSMYAERDRICGSRAQIDLVEFTLLKAYLASGRMEEAKRLLGERRPGPAAAAVAGAEAVRVH